MQVCHRTFVERLLVSVDCWLVKRAIAVLGIRPFNYYLAGWLTRHRAMVTWRWQQQLALRSVDRVRKFFISAHRRPHQAGLTSRCS